RTEPLDVDRHTAGRSFRWSIDGPGGDGADDAADDVHVSVTAWQGEGDGAAHSRGKGRRGLNEDPAGREIAGDPEQEGFGAVEVDRSADRNTSAARVAPDPIPAVGARFAESIARPIHEARCGLRVGGERS